MTEEYKSRLFSRISKLNYTNYTLLKRTGILICISLISLGVGYISGIFYGGDTASSNVKDILISHFCGFFSGLGILDSIRAAISFTLGDIFFILSVLAVGYTMLSAALGKLILIIYSARLGGCIALLYDMLITDPCIENGKSAFALFILAKLSVLCALVFSVIQSEDFSFRFCEIFNKQRFPIKSRESVSYIKTLSSTAGFTALINIIYLIFQSIQKYTPIV
ncbi:MAG: hypothetical protein U0M06_10640 [Clostridia bacterium]|nr:hypothetical protein [Clostridia bacterium]